MGHLVARGTIALAQFWPNGLSDGDTTKVKVTSFVFEKKPTHVFDRARVVGRGGPKPVLNARGEITVRWQGIDAPELHYDPALPDSEGRDGDYRQHHGEAAPVALGKFLGGLAKGRGTIRCTVETEVETPNDVFDTYGRFIGTIYVESAGKGGRLSLNMWMVREGLAYPTFYASMSAGEIRELAAAAAEAKRRRKGIWRGESSSLKFDSKLRFHAGGPVERGDGGDVRFPKVFRRLATCYAATGRAAGLREYLASKAPDWCYLTEEFLEQGAAAATPRRLSEFVNGKGFEAGPGELVFKEAESRLVAANGRSVKQW
jgi:endonuclease YncB( thermonuclease family)